jgi:radical SAM protein with 4Fe4S-binding SPASM domain
MEGMEMQADKFLIEETPSYKKVRSLNYNYNFNKKNGQFARWGKTLEDDPSYAISPEILDLEISSGGCTGACPWCYKSNPKQLVHNLSLEEFKTIFHKMPPILTQIAFGITDINTNPDFFDMMEYAKEHGVIPNYTTHGIGVDDGTALATSVLCGAVAVSVYEHTKQYAYDAIQKFIKAGMKQVNIHYMLAQETLNAAFNVVQDIVHDERLKGLNAIVFLQYKDKGRGKGNFHSIQDAWDYKRLMDFCEMRKVGYGFDSCSAPLYFKAVEHKANYRSLTQFAEPCESSLFSSYINCYGEFFPCSFTENSEGWDKGISVLEANDFIKDVWNNERVAAFRNTLISSSSRCISCKSQKICRSCPVYDVSACKEE